MSVRDLIKAGISDGINQAGSTNPSDVSQSIQREVRNQLTNNIANVMKIFKDNVWKLASRLVVRTGYMLSIHFIKKN